MRGITEARRALVATMVVLAGASDAGCGEVTQAKPDGGDGSISLGDALGPGRHAFDVIAALSPTDGGGAPPPSNNFTLVIDVDAGVAIAGGSGMGAVVGITSSDGRTFRSTAPFSVGGSGDACSGPESVTYESLTVTIDGGRLSGDARGTAMISCGDCSFTVPFTARLAGTADQTTPTLHSFGTVPASPFDSFALRTSEPLPTTATARLVTVDGAGIDLIPTVVDGALPIVIGYSKPDVVLRAGQAYFVTFDGLVDFARLVDPSGTPLGLTSFPAAPTVPEDGFESAAGATLGGAMVMTTAGPLPPIAGSTSLYIGAPNAPGLDAANGRSLMVRLSRPAEKTTIRFSYQVVASQSPPQFPGVLRFGSEGTSADQTVTSFGTTQPIGMLTVGGQPAYASAVGVMSVALPAGVTDQILVYIAPISVVCRPIGVVNAGLLIDDLRLE